MATAEIGSLRLTLAMNAGEFERGSRRAKRELDTLGSKILDVSEKINRASVLITTGLFAAQRFANAASGIFNVASAFEKGMANVSTLVDTTTESMKDMSRQVLEIGQRTPVAISELTTALYDIRSAGISASDALGVLENSARLGVAGLGTTKEAVDLVTSSINAFGLEGEEASRIYDLVFKTVKAGKTTISELAQGFGAVAGTVAQAGIKIDDYLASIAALTTTGLPAAQAHTQIRAAIAGLLRETTETKALFDALNAKTFKDLVQQSGSVVTAFQRIVIATRGNDAQLIKLLGSVEAYNALVGLAGKQNQAYVNTLQNMRLGQDEVDEAFKKQNETLDSTLKRLRNNIESVATSIGQVLTPTINSMADKVAGLAKAFTELSPETQTMVAHLIAFVGVVAPAVIALGFFVNALASLAPVVMTIVETFAILTGTVAGIIAAGGPIGLFIAAAGLAAVAWYTFKDDIIVIWQSVSDFIGEKVDGLISKFQELAQSQRMGFLSEEEWNKLTAPINNTAETVNRAAKSFNLMGFEFKTTTENVLPSAADKFRNGFVIPVSEGLKELEKLWERHNERARQFGAQVIKDISSPTELLVAQQTRLKEALDAGGLTVEQYGRAMAKAAYVSQNAYAQMASGIIASLQQAFGENKAVAIAAAIVNTYEAFTKALAAYPPPFNYAAAAAALAAGFAQVANIRKTTKNSTGGGGGGAAASPNTGGGPGTAPQQLIVQGLSSDQMFTGDNVALIANRLLDYQRNGGQVVIQRS